jgi:hypothetical protein
LSSLQSLLEGLEGSGLSVALRASEWVYPLINTLHILGIALLVGSILILDVRLLRRRTMPAVSVLADVLLYPARGGWALALGTGLLLFISRPLDYAFHTLFQLKLACMALALVNIVWLHRSDSWHSAMTGNPPDGRVRLAGGVSLVCWLLVLGLGRLVGYR